MSKVAFCVTVVFYLITCIPYIQILYFILQAEEHNTKMQELNKFVHYYTRFKNHENSFKVS